MDEHKALPILQPEAAVERTTQLKLISDHPGYQGSDDLRNHIGDTVKLRRPKITVDALGRNVWAGEVAGHDFEIESPEVATDPYNTLTFEDY